MNRNSSIKRETVDILGVKIDKVSMFDALLNAQRFAAEEGCAVIYTPNSEIIMEASGNNKLREALDDADMLVPDGIGVVWASKINGNSVKEKVAGFDLMKKILSKADENKQKVFLLGGKPEIAEEAIAKLKVQLPNIDFVGYHDGYFTEDQEADIIESINSLKPHFLFVALGAPKQELFIHKYKGVLEARVAMGVGGSFDILAGKAKRAPKIFIKLGLEWFYRLIKEPWRYKRMLILPKFGLAVIRKRLKS